MPDFWPIQLETSALPNVPFPPITLVFICLPTSRKLLKDFYECIHTHVNMAYCCCCCFVKTEIQILLLTDKNLSNNWS